MTRRSLYEQQYAHTEQPFYLHSDGLITLGKARPTREEMIESYLAMPIYECRKRDGKPGYEIVAGPSFASRGTAELAVARYFKPEQDKERDAA